MSLGMERIPDLFSRDLITTLLHSDQVLEAKEKLQRTNIVSFSYPVTSELVTTLHDTLGLDFTNLQSIPMRWIQGDTPAHTDRGSNTFETTYLVYLTDSPGAFIIDNESYPLTQNTAFVFNEGLRHETVNTGTEPRLLLGPFSEQGFPVGIAMIQGDGGQTAYIRENSGTNEWSLDQTNWNPLYFPCGLQNTNTSAGIFTIEFLTNITLTTLNDYFVCFSSDIQIGSTSLQTNGLRAQISVNVTNFEGLIENGSSGGNGYDNIRIYNLIVDGAGGTQQIGAGWFGKQYFGKGTTNNFVVHCSSYGDIHGGGILGRYAEHTTLKSCSSYGEIVEATAGGIVGAEVTEITIDSCWSEGAISANGCGGMAGSNTYSLTITKCYSTGVISGANAGGILGSNGGLTEATISNCYATGAITGGNAGGICGSIGTSSDTHTLSITNCYTTGNLNNTGSNYNGCILGFLIVFGSGAVNITIGNCYTTGTVVLAKGYVIANLTTINGISSGATTYVLSGNYSEAGSAGGAAGSWDSTHAASTLTNVPSSEPGVGTSWVSTGTSQPYELNSFGITPYQIQTISGTSLVQSYSQTVQKGSSSVPSILPDASGNAFAILGITGGDSSSYTSITISAQTGVISTTSSTASGVYTVTVRSAGSYNITTFLLTVEEQAALDALACCDRTLDLKGMDYTTRAEVLSGNMILSQVTERRTALSYTDMIRMKQAQQAKR